MDAVNGHDGRDTSASPSDSSDFYSTESTPPAITGPPDGAISETAPATDQRDPDSSEMDLSEPSQPTTPALSADALPKAVSSNEASHAGAKRKLGDAELGAGGSTAGVTDEQTKKRKVDVAMPSRLPPAIWQRIFVLLPPAMLCRCLRVCKEFNHMLTATKAPQPPQKDKSTARIVDSEVIWIHARKTFFPALPRPLLQYTELDMLKLIGGQNCQFCGKAPLPPPATNPFNCGPGIDGVRVIFPFGVRTCGPCIEPLLRKDVQLLTEPTSARLRLGISFAYRNEEYHFVTESVRQAPPGIPGNLRFSKVYYQPHLAAIQQEEDDAQQLGQGAAEEWRKGLYNKGKAAMADSARWEKWEAQLPLGASLAQVLKCYDLSSFPHRPQDVQSKPVGVSTAELPILANGPHPLPQPVYVFSARYQPQFLPGQPPGQPPPLPQQHMPFPPHPLSHQLPFPPQQPQQSRPIRNPQEVESARQARRAEIERRCQELEPPVAANLLQHMESFQAAMQITTPLTEAAWEMLKPRILAQREAAELTAHTRAEQFAALQAAMPSVGSQDRISKPAKDSHDREHEDAQLPLRNKLAEYADDIINGRWSGGDNLTRENVPIFAIQVLQHVNQRYVEDKTLGLLPDFEAAAKKKTPTRQGSPPPAPFLSLENMKWAYDNKVRPLTDKHRKEHFICAGCEEEKKPKWFAFEGLIQHYGAKHTTAFSKGNIVVHWQTAEWPETPPFHTNPAPWLRRALESRKEHKAKSTPQSNNHEGSFQGDIAGSVPVPKRPSHSYQRHNPFAPQGSSNGYPSGVDHAAIAALQAGREAQHLQLASDSREIWDALDGVPDMLECIKLQTALHFAVVKFEERHYHKPNLDLLTDALATHNAMRPLKNVTGLACRLCVAKGKTSHSTSYWTRIRDAKFYNTSSLVTHFKLCHQPHEQAASTHWLDEMIELPEHDVVKQLLRTRGMDDAKLALVAAAFPSVFSTPLPKIGHVTEDLPQQSAYEAPVSSLFGRFSKKQKTSGKKKGQKAVNGAQDREYSTEPLPEPKEDEYDPLRPALVPTQSYDPAQFDTDARKRKRSSPEPPAAPSSSGPDPNPDTAAMLQYLEQYSQQPRAPTASRMSRSPSVGRPESANAANVPASAPGVTNNGQPDIGAILAALTGQGQAATAPAFASNGSGSVHGQHFANVERRETRSSASKGPHHATATHSNGTQQALPRVSVAPEFNDSHVNHIYEPAPYPAHSHSAAPQPHYQAAPVQYRYEVPHTPVYRQHPQPQYVQVPVPGAEYGYQYERPPANPVYVDQYGNPLILVDAGPAPIQYVPNPHDPQQHYGVHQEHPVYAQPQPVYDDRRPVYYEQAPSAVPTRYAYDERASVGRP